VNNQSINQLSSEQLTDHLEQKIIIIYVCKYAHREEHGRGIYFCVIWRLGSATLSLYLAFVSDC
jgi:hypothetical protein